MLKNLLNSVYNFKIIQYFILSKSYKIETNKTWRLSAVSPATKSKLRGQTRGRPMFGVGILAVPTWTCWEFMVVDLLCPVFFSHLYLKIRKKLSVFSCFSPSTFPASIMFFFQLLILLHIFLFLRYSTLDLPRCLVVV